MTMILYVCLCCFAVGCLLAWIKYYSIYCVMICWHSFCNAFLFSILHILQGLLIISVSIFRHIIFCNKINQYNICLPNTGTLQIWPHPVSQHFSIPGQAKSFAHASRQMPIRPCRFGQSPSFSAVKNVFCFSF